MRNKQSLILIFSLLIALALSACTFSLAQDVQPPAGYQPPVYEEPEVLTGAAPVAVPNPENGRQLYAEKCEACHGPSGLGDGQDSTALPNEVARIGAPNVANLASPLEWYSIILKGNIERFMPPFEASLSPSDVWDVLAYVYTFGASPDVVAQGGEVFASTCAECHGADGSGEGGGAGSSSGLPGAANFLDAERMVTLSLEEMINKAATGNGNDAHIFSNQLTADEIEAAALYVRSLTFPLAGQPVEAVADQPAAEEPPAEDTGTEEPVDSTTDTPADAAAEDTGIVTGLVTNGSGGDLPTGLEVQLEVYESFEMIYSDTVPVKADGTYQFDDVPLDPALIYITLIEMNGTFFPSDFHMGEETVGTTIDLPITYYDSTTDPSSLAVSRLHAFFTFTDQGTVQVIHQVSISNRGSLMVAPEQDTDPVLNFSLPEGATNLIFQSGMIGNPYIQTADGFADPTPVIPGESSYEILFAYELPFDRKLDWQLPLDLPTDVAVLFVEGDTLDLSSDTLMPSGVETLDQGVFQVMAADTLAAGDTIDLQLSTPLLGGGSSGQSNWLPILLGVVGLGLAGFGAWRFFGSPADRGAPGEHDQVDTLLDRIVALDEAFEAGELDSEDYQLRRAELKSRVSEMLAGKDND